MKSIILASGSPRRKELLEQVGISFQVIPSKVKEVITKKEPREIVMELALQKAWDVAESHRDHLVIGSDTVVVFQGMILGKPKDEEDAINMLSMLSGKTHQVYTGVAMVSSEKQELFYERTDVTFYDLEEQEIKQYVETKDCMDKAGAYGIQGNAARFIRGIQGDYYNVVGFPIARFLQELKKFL